MAQLIAVHLRHDYVANDERGLAATRGFERQPAVGGAGDVIAMLLEDVLKPFRLRGTVFHDQYFQRWTASICSCVHASIPPGDSRLLTSVMSASAILSEGN